MSPLPWKIWGFVFGNDVKMQIPNPPECHNIPLKVSKFPPREKYLNSALQGFTFLTLILKIQWNYSAKLLLVGANGIPDIDPIVKHVNSLS